MSSTASEVRAKLLKENGCVSSIELLINNKEEGQKLVDTLGELCKGEAIKVDLRATLLEIANNSGKFEDINSWTFKVFDLLLKNNLPTPHKFLLEVKKKRARSPDSEEAMTEDVDEEENEDQDTE